MTEGRFDSPTGHWRLMVVGVVLAMLVVACGGTSSSDGGTASTAPANDSVTSAAPASTSPGSNDSEQEVGTTEGSSQDIPSGSGSATLTLGDETIEFDEFICFFDEAAGEAFGDEDITFAGYVPVETSEETTPLAVSAKDSPVGQITTVAYILPEPGTQWQLVGSEAFMLEGGQVTDEGDFQSIVDFEHTEVYVHGVFNATCD